MSVTDSVNSSMDLAMGAEEEEEDVPKESPTTGLLSRKKTKENAWVDLPESGEMVTEGLHLSRTFSWCDELAMIFFRRQKR
mmetsp:Transcript_32615/g.68029  ORF Transcript_32615/g.68029 Transcript_32615/m.68029 type:complete len:81 (-) Transcript_32615:773-1015(-)